MVLVLVLFTDHTFMTWNENLLLLNPLSLALIVLVPLSRGRPGAGRAAIRLAGLVVLLAAAALLPWIVPAFRQQNAIFLGLILPAHLGLWWGLRAPEADPTQAG